MANPADSTSFTVPLNFEGLSLPSAGPNFIDLSALSSTSPDSLLSLCSTPNDDQDAFTSLYALISRYPTLSLTHRTSTLTAVRSYATFSASSTSSTSAPLSKRAVFLLGGAAAAAEKETAAKKRKDWDKTGRDALLEAARAVLDAVGSVSTGVAVSWAQHDRAELAGVLLRMVLSFLESVQAARDKATRKALAVVLNGLLAVDAAQTLPATTGVVHLLSKHEHVAAAGAEVFAWMAEEEGGGTALATDVVVEITRMDPDHLARDTACAKACAGFIGEVAERLPKVAGSNIALVLGMLDGDSYTMRNGVLHCIGRLLKGMVEEAGQAETRDSLFEILLDRAMRDVNAYTRSKALQTWCFLAENRAVSRAMFPLVAAVAASRLEDRTAAVRRAAAQLLCAMMSSNPYGPSLRLSHYNAKLEEFGGLQEEDEAAADEDADADAAADADGESEDGDAEEPVVDKENDPTVGNGQAGDDETDVDEPASSDEDEEGEKSPTKAVEDAAAAAAAAEGEEKEEEKLSEEETKRIYYKQSVQFVTTVELGLLSAYKMLRSTNITDVSESVNLLVTALEFKVEAAASGRATRAMLALVLAREAKIKGAAIDAYQVLLAPPLGADGGRLSLDGGDVDKGPSMLVTRGLIDLVVGATTGEVACLGVLISELMKRESSIITPAVVAIMWDMFSGKIPGASQEQRCAACIYVGMFAAVRPDTLQSRVRVLEDVGLSSETTAYVQWTCVALQKLPPGSDREGNICRHLVRIIEDGSAGVVAVEQAIGALYVLHPSPEEHVAGMLLRMHQAVFKRDGDGGEVSDVQVGRLSQFLHVVGHIAVKQLVRIETLVAAVRRSAAKEEEEEAGAEAEKALEFAESELTASSSLLGQYGAMASAISADEKAPTELRSSAVLCMAKLMCIKSSFCDANLQLLFTVLERANDASVRANAITSLGDLAFRFPNLVEPWSPRIYAALEDKHVRVRKNALMALTHLILNDMVKVKGQMVGLALRVLDKDERIEELARVFFQELSRKDANAIYNILPDTISCLSRRKDLGSTEMKKVVAFLMGYLDKGWHAEKLVEKLCQRFRTSESEQETRDISFCIAQLNLNEKCLGKLSDNFKLFAPALSDDEVHTHITAAIAKAKKNAALSKGSGAAKNAAAAAAAAGGEEAGDCRSRADELMQQIERQRKSTGEGEE